MNRAVIADAGSLSELLSAFGLRVESNLTIGRSWRSMIEPGDMMQVPSLEAFLQISTFRPGQAGAFEAWLRSIAENNLRGGLNECNLQRPFAPARKAAAFL